jgi:hypothetical protein
METIMKKIFIFLFFVLIVSGCASIQNDNVSKEGEINRTLVEGKAKDGITVTGIAAADTKLTSKTQRMATSRKAAIIEAQQQLLGQLKGAQLTNGDTVENAMLSDARTRSEIDGLIKGAKIIKTEWVEDDGCSIILNISKDQLKKQGIKVD